MTRYPPQGQQGGYQGSNVYNYQQGNEPSYGANDSEEGQSYQHTQSYPPYQQPYGGEAPGAAQGYYVPDEQAYRQYPNQPYGGYNQGAPPPGASHVAPHMQPPQYGDNQYPPLSQYPPYGQEQHYPLPQGPAPPSYGMQGGSDVEQFKSHYEQPYGSIDPSTGQPLPAGAGAEGDRGVMGALAGGAAGVYGGHKMGHGFIGGVGGAVAGSMLEDAYKKHNKKDKKQKRRDSSCSSSSSSDSDRRHSGGVMAGNFSASSRDVHMEGRCTLVAECVNCHGHHHTSHLDLNDCFTNSNGRLEWARGGNFAASARNIRLTDGGAAMEAELGDGRGGWRHNKVYLNERITNEDGRLQML